MTDLELYDEQFVLACLLEKPQENAWELSGLRSDLFENPIHRQIARALEVVRDSGKRVHWRRVRKLLRSQDLQDARSMIWALVWRCGPQWGLTAAMSRLVYRRANRRHVA